MKNIKNVVLVLFLAFFTSNAYAISLGDIIGDGKDPAKSLNKGLDKKIDKIVKKFEDKVDGKIKKYEDQIKEAQATMDKINYIRANSERYIRNAKIVLAILSSGILALLFVMWRIWRNIVTMKKVIKNVANYDDIEKRLKKLEKKIS